MRTVEVHGAIFEITERGAKLISLSSRAFEAVERVGSAPPPPIDGLGDKIARIAQPIARAIDKVAGTKIAKCVPCKKMKERLNAGMPIAEALKRRIKGV